MQRQTTRINPIEKNRIRAEIDAQVRQYLQGGGKIDVLVANRQQAGTAIGSVWRVDDISELDR